MIENHWRRIAGLHVKEDGDIGCVWAAHDKDSDMIHLYDACIFRREVLAVIAEALNARGRWIPVAWEDKAMADKLLERGCNMLPEPCKETDATAEVASRDVWERMRSGRFKADKRLKEWIDEFQTFDRSEQKVPRDTHPLMSATRFAVTMLPYARRQSPPGGKKAIYPKLAMI